jgi:hypothetical protein
MHSKSFLYTTALLCFPKNLILWLDSNPCLSFSSSAPRRQSYRVPFTWTRQPEMFAAWSAVYASHVKPGFGDFAKKHRPETDVTIFYIYSPPKNGEKLAFLAQSKAELCRSLIVTLFVEKNANFFAENR